MDVLVVEDSPVVRREIVKDLGDVPGVSGVVAVSCVAEARGALAAATFGLWVLDFELGDGTALDLLRDRDARPGEQSLAVVVTVAPSPPLRARCLDVGARCFDKSTEWQDVLDCVERLAAGATSC